MMARVYEPEYGTLIGHVEKAFCLIYVILSHYCNHNHLRNKVLTITVQIIISLATLMSTVQMH